MYTRRRQRTKVLTWTTPSIWFTKARQPTKPSHGRTPGAVYWAVALNFTRNASKPTIPARARFARNRNRGHPKRLPRRSTVLRISTLSLGMKMVGVTKFSKRIALNVPSSGTRSKNRCAMLCQASMSSEASSQSATPKYIRARTTRNTSRRSSMIAMYISDLISLVIQPRTILLKSESPSVLSIIHSCCARLAMFGQSMNERLMQMPPTVTAAHRNLSHVKRLLTSEKPPSRAICSSRKKSGARRFCDQ
mmetsp:Transcript_76231/g.215552  ORF Transcript_76231/g.215552 Transcript_76231/m.215552 type:complete len:249 (-) Transcript_76231:177-923(-)